MKSTSLLFFAAALMAGAAFAENVTKSVLTFSTPGPDIYADGTPIADGETYFLVFVPTGTETWTVSNTGEIDGATFIAQSQAKKGACRPVNVIFDLDDPAYANGSFYILALDTRGEDGQPGSDYIYSYGIAGETSGIKAGSISLASTAAVLSQGISAGGSLPVLPSDFPAPVITSLQVKDGQAVLSAAVADGTRYTVQSADSLGGEWTQATKSLSVSVLNADGGITIPVDPEKPRQFFKIVRGE